MFDFTKILYYSHLLLSRGCNIIKARKRKNTDAEHRSVGAFDRPNEKKEGTEMKYAIGIDLGGTDIAAGLADRESKTILHTGSTKTRAPRSL